MLRAVPSEVPIWIYEEVATKAGIKMISYSRHIFEELQKALKEGDIQKGDILIFSKKFILTTSETKPKLEHRNPGAFS